MKDVTKKPAIAAVNAVESGHSKPRNAPERVEFAAMAAGTVEASSAALAAPAEIPIAVPELPARPEPAARVDNRVDKVDEEAAVRAALERYQEAYGHLDASAVKRIWPGVDERALSKAFANLESQSIAFDDCKSVVSPATAFASCRGTATYAGRLGSRNSRTENRQWTFRLRKEGSGWAVQNVQVR